MTTPVLYIGNQNYSSWSLRPWLALRWGQIAFETRLVQLGGAGYAMRQIPAVLAVSPSGTVPALHLGQSGNDIIYDSLAIAEWAAEQTPTLWPRGAIARAHARSAACEMHAGFGALRDAMPANIRRRTTRAPSEDVQRDIARIEAIWANLRTRFGAGGPYLFGATPTITDAFYAPVATRFRTYAVPLSSEAQQYVDALLADAAFREWETAAIAEPWTIPQSDA